MLGGLAACVSGSPPPLRGRLLGREQAERGHRVWQPAALGAISAAVDLVIVGAGVAGVCAAWRLWRAGFRGSVLWLDLGAHPGGTAAWGVSGVGEWAWGAHYITMPSPETRHVRVLLEEVGVITGWQGERPLYDPLQVCLAPEERLFVGAEWIEGLWPAVGATDEDRAQLLSFTADCARWSQRIGADGKPAFALPVARCSDDPEIRALAQVSFADWLDQQGYTSPRLRWWLEYACRDDFGTRLAQTSAWAGLHYQCARRPDPADDRDLGSHVLTWPAGNGQLVRALLRRLPYQPVPRAVVRRVVPQGDAVDVGFEADTLRTVRARYVILATPAAVADKLVDRPAVERPVAIPWRVAALTVPRLPKSRGVAMAWDSVPYGARGLGYVNNQHQLGRYAGPAVLTCYEPLSDLPPAEARRMLLQQTWEAEADAVLADLSKAHPDLRGLCQGLDVWHWGHGTVAPSVGLHASDRLAAAARPLSRVSFAHTDLSGMSLFEEASWHGIRAAEEALAVLGPPSPESLL